MSGINKSKPLRFLNKNLSSVEILDPNTSGVSSEDDVSSLCDDIESLIDNGDYKKQFMVAREENGLGFAITLRNIQQGNGNPVSIFTASIDVVEGVQGAPTKSRIVYQCKVDDNNIKLIADVISKMHNPRINNCKNIDIAIMLLTALQGKKDGVFNHEAVSKLINAEPKPEQSSVKKLLELVKMKPEDFQVTPNRPARRI